MERPRGEDFIKHHCFECGNTFDCTQNLELHRKATLHNPRFNILEWGKIPDLTMIWNIDKWRIQHD